jgi:hypothetical protein
MELMPSRMAQVPVGKANVTGKVNEHSTEAICSLALSKYLNGKPAGYCAAQTNLAHKAGVLVISLFHNIKVFT